MKEYPTDPAGELDAGAVEREQPCSRRTWCLLHVNHHGTCVEVPQGRKTPIDEAAP